MTTILSRSLNAVLCYAAFAIVGLAMIAWGATANPRERSFDLPADAAEKSIKRFSQQAELEVFYLSSVAKGLRTQPVKGRMSAREALNAMLAGTGLVVIQDEKTGAFTVMKKDPPPADNAAGAKTGSIEPAWTGTEHDSVLVCIRIFTCGNPLMHAA
jgi:hypothetical protein